LFFKGIHASPLPISVTLQKILLNKFFKETVIITFTFTQAQVT